MSEVVISKQTECNHLPRFIKATSSGR